MYSFLKEIANATITSASIITIALQNLLHPKVIAKDVMEEAQKGGKREGLCFYC